MRRVEHRRNAALHRRQVGEFADVVVVGRLTEDELAEGALLKLIAAEDGVREVVAGLGDHAGEAGLFDKLNDLVHLVDLDGDRHGGDDVHAALQRVDDERAMGVALGEDAHGVQIGIRREHFVERVVGFNAERVAALVTALFVHIRRDDLFHIGMHVQQLHEAGAEAGSDDANA